MNNYQMYNNQNQTSNFANNDNLNNLYNPYDGFIRGNMFPNLYDSYKLTSPYNVEPLNEQATLLTYIDTYLFAAHDLNLYLDNFPNDHNAIELFNKYRKEYNNYLDEYQSKYGPLLINSDAMESFPWAWINEPWPWDVR